MKQITFITDNLEEPGEVYHAVERAAADNDAKVRTIDRFSVEESVLHRLWSLLETSELIIADITRNSPNLIYEIGLAHGLGKPVLILTNQTSIRLPPDLRGQFIIDYRTDGERLDILKFKLSKLIPSAWGENGNLGPLRGPRQVNHLPDISEHPIKSEFRKLLELNGKQRQRQFNDWFSELARCVQGWEVFSAPEEHFGDDSGYDFVIWNSFADTELEILGNPIPIELKAAETLNSDLLERLAHKAQVQGLEGVIIGSVAKATKRNKTLVRDIFIKKNFPVILLNREDLLRIKSPKDLFDHIKTKLLYLIYEVDS